MPYTHSHVYPRAKDTYHSVQARLAMPYTHSHVYPRAKDTYHSVQARVYPADSPKPHFRNIMTHDNGTQQFALTQNVLHHVVQPYTHFREATVIDRRKRHKFYLAGTEWRGNIVIMRGAANGDGLVNMRGNDARLSDFLVKRYVTPSYIRRPKLICLFLELYILFDKESVLIHQKM
ncbi:hypothetical protein CVT24_011910 [Panaeolus cyanescens]|uniref:Uncharacterized protein n=1 Tax=Panaeolus cyanescens TaxID=181874 RepID=A0A409YNH5_9AGAR|nr:hypothetical protein CVT24_011910 [Panaeolus cyanescens]